LSNERILPFDLSLVKEYCATILLRICHLVVTWQLNAWINTQNKKHSVKTYLFASKAAVNVYAY